MKPQDFRNAAAELFWVIQHLRTAELFCAGSPEWEQVEGLLRQAQALRTQLRAPWCP
jgi:hypothetical protein